MKTLALLLVPLISLCLGEGNIRLMEEEISKALQDCIQFNQQVENGKRQRRHDENNSFSRIDAKQEISQYNHERRNKSYKTQFPNTTELDYSRYGYGSNGSFINSGLQHTIDNSNTYGNTKEGYKRTKRGQTLLGRDDADKCLSQCVFANLQVLDSKGIPREGKLWPKIQTSVTSQQSQALIRDQIQACFQELTSESEDNGCSYSNKLERCLMLRFSDRVKNNTKNVST